MAVGTVHARIFEEWPVRVRVVVLFCAAVFMNAAALRAEEPAAIVLDSWWNVDYAKQNCRWPGTITPPEACERNMVTGVRDFEDRLATYMATDPQCKGVRLVRYGGPSSDNANEVLSQKSGFWSLSLNYQPGAIRQAWAMIKEMQPSTYTKGEGDPKEIAGNVCAIATGRGAKLD